MELATAVGATCCGIDASPRLIAVARDRNPDADLRVGDMHDLPWDDASFDVVTSFRGIWGTTPDAVAEAHRVLAPGGRLGITVWGHIKVSPGAWALAPLALASEPKVEHQAAMVALGRPGRGEELLAQCGFVDVERHEIPFVWEFADPDAYARAMSSLGPAYEAIQNVGEEEFIRWATEHARQRVRDGLPLRAPIAAVGYVARKPSMARAGSCRPVGGDVVPRRRAALAGRAAALRRRRERDGLRHERLQALGPRSGGDECDLRPARSRRRIRSAHVPAASDPRHVVRSGPRRLVLRAGMGQPAGRRGRRRGGRARDPRRRRAARQQRAGARRLGPPADPGSELDDSRGRGVTARRRLRRRADLRHLRVRRAPHRVLHGQRRARRPTRLATGCRRARCSPRRDHVRPAGRAAPSRSDTSGRRDRRAETATRLRRRKSCTDRPGGDV